MNSSCRLILLLSVLCLAGCGRHGGQGDGKPVEIPISLRSATGENLPLVYSDFINETYFFKVQTNQTFANVRDVKYVGGKYYLSDRNRIFIFDEKGVVSLVLDKRGRGAGEYIAIDAYDIDLVSGEIHVYDIASRRFQVFSAEGVWVRSVIPEERVSTIRDFALLEDGRYLTYRPDHSDSAPKGLLMLGGVADSKKCLPRRTLNIKPGPLTHRPAISIA